MLFANRLSLIASAGILALSLSAAPLTAPAQTPPPLPPAAEDNGRTGDDLPPPISRRGDNDGPPPVNNDDGPSPVNNDDDGPPPPPVVAYYVLIGGNQMGPLSEVELIELIKSGQMTDQTQVWKKGMAAWDSAGGDAELAALIEKHRAAAPPPSPPPPPGPEYFVIVNGQQVGPLKMDQLKQAIGAGQITRQTQIWTQGMAGWTAAGDVPELAALFPPAPDNRTAEKVRVESYCGATRKSGIGEGPDFNTARDRAIKACIANGGLPECCPNSVRQIE